MPYTFKRIIFFLILLSSLSCRSFSQCTVQTGPPPAANTFSSAKYPAGSYVPPGSPDLNWTVAQDSITGIYKPAIVMTGLPVDYHDNLAWISFSATGEHNSDRYFFYKRDFDLPCFNPCGKSYNDNNTFCLNLDLYADNSIYEIYVNGVAQSANLGAGIPDANPFNPNDLTVADKTQVSLCSNWKAGSNTLIIVVASSATVSGLLVKDADLPPPPPDSDTIDVAICDGETYHFAEKDLNKTGYYFHSFPRSSGCDSNVVLHLDVKQKAASGIKQSICEGQSFMGHTVTGVYTSHFTAANGCDSSFTLDLNVELKPRPDLGIVTAICEGDTIHLSPGDYTSYLWQDGSTDDHYVVTKPGAYSVTATNTCGIGSSQITITNGVCNPYFPTAFTPNSDGKNDNFKILTHLQLTDYHLIVYNRWGEKVFETTDRSRVWDGSFNGKKLDSGVFVWYCSFKRENVSTTMKGTVALIR